MLRKERFKLRHSVEYKLSLMLRYESGATVRELSKESGINATQIKDFARYRDIDESMKQDLVKMLE